MAFKFIEPRGYSTKEDAKHEVERHRKIPLEKMTFEQLFYAAQIEREGLMHMSRNVDWGMDVLKGGDMSRYHEICEVIAAKLIHTNNQKDIENFYQIGGDGRNINHLKTRGDVEEIIKDKYEKSVKDFNELKEHYLAKKEDYQVGQNLISSLGNALFSHLPLGDEIALSGKTMLDNLRGFKDRLISTQEGKLSIVQQLKESGDPMILKVLKGIMLTLVTGFGYAGHAIHQAVTGGSYKGIDSAGEQLAKNAERRLYPERYESIHHVKGGVQTPTPEAPQKGTGEEQVPPSTPSPKG